MTPLTISLIAFIAGGVITGGVMVKIADSKEEQQDIDKIIESLETQFEKAQASVVVSLTETDLLKVPCSAEYIKENGDLLCREMFCRMNRQGGGQNSGGGAGATAQDCSAISETSLSLIAIDKCMAYWSDDAGKDQNSQFHQCKKIFGEKK